MQVAFKGHRNERDPLEIFPHPSPPLSFLFMQTLQPGFFLFSFEIYFSAKQSPNYSHNELVAKLLVHVLSCFSLTPCLFFPHLESPFLPHLSLNDVFIFILNLQNSPRFLFQYEAFPETHHDHRDNLDNHDIKVPFSSQFFNLCAPILFVCILQEFNYPQCAQHLTAAQLNVYRIISSWHSFIYNLPAVRRVFSLY